MDQLNVETIRKDLREFLSRDVLGRASALADDAILADEGVDSFALMETVLFIERRYGLVVPIDRLTRENTRSIRTLGDCVAAVAG